MRGNEIRSSGGTTQGDPVAMTVYAIIFIPLILMTVEKTSSYTENLIAAGKAIQLKHCLDLLSKLGLTFR